MTIYVVEMNEWGCGLYGGAGNLLTFFSFCDKNTGVRVICGAGLGYSPENTVIAIIFSGGEVALSTGSVVSTYTAVEQVTTQAKKALKSKFWL